MSEMSKSETPAAGDGGERLPGAKAKRPLEIPPRGWLQILKRVAREVGQDDLPLVAAGLAFFAVLGLFPMLTLVVAIYSQVADPQQVQQLLVMIRPLLPAEAQQLVAGQLQALTGGEPTTGLGFSLLLSLGLLLWSASTGTQSLIRAIDLVYEEEEERSFLKLRLLAVAFTLGAIVFFVVSVGSLAVLPEVLERIGLEAKDELLLKLIRWPALAAVCLLGLSILYRWAPDRRNARWQWISWGSVIATVLWISASAAFSYYAREMGSYNETYGTLGAAVVLLLWLFLSAFAVLLGAEINSEIEHQTARDSTVGPERPLGERDAFVADHRPGSAPRPEENPEKDDQRKPVAPADEGS